MLTVVNAEIKILDYSNSQIIPINTGYAKVQTGTFKLIHVIEPDNFQNLINIIQQTLSYNVSQSHPLYPFLYHEANQLQNHLNRIKPRIKRSLDFIGSAWKWIAGNPDHADFEIIEQKINNALENNNKQVVINRLTMDNINDLARTTNQIVKFIKSHEIPNETFITTLKYKIDLLKEELLNIQNAIHWAKVGIVNSFILSNKEVNIVKHIFEKDSVPFINLEEAFEFSEARIASNNNSLIYIVSIPTTEKKSCSKVLIRPTKSGKFVNKISYKDVLMCNNSTYGIKNTCKSHNKLTICNIQDIENIDNDTCVTNLLQGNAANCTLTSNNLIPTIEEITPGLILLNQYNGTVYINNEPRNLVGTYLLQYQNVTITVANKVYNYFQLTEAKPIPAIFQSRLPGSAIEEVLTLETVNELNLNNTKYIDLLDTKNRWNSIITIGLFIICISLIAKIWTTKTHHVEVRDVVTSTPSVQVPQPQWPAISLANPQQIPRLSKIPYF